MALDGEDETSDSLIGLVGSEGTEAIAADDARTVTRVVRPLLLPGARHHTMPAADQAVETVALALDPNPTPIAVRWLEQCHCDGYWPSGQPLSEHILENRDR